MMLVLVRFSRDWLSGSSSALARWRSFCSIGFVSKEVRADLKLVTLFGGRGQAGLAITLGFAATDHTAGGLQRLRCADLRLRYSPQKSPQNDCPGVIFNDLRYRPCVPSHCKHLTDEP